MTKRDWRLIIAAFGILAVLWTAGGFIAADQYRRIDQNTQRLKDTTARLKGLAINVAASQCLHAYTRDRAADRKLVEDYIAGRPISLSQYGPACPAAAQRARQQVGEGP